MKDLYVDSVLGEWKLFKKTKKDLIYERKATVKLHESNKVSYYDPKTLQEYHVWGDVVLIQQKVHNIETGNQSYFKNVNVTNTSEKSLVIK